jgi:hypothetical protein
MGRIFMRTFRVSLLARLALVLVLAGCGRAHVRNATAADDLASYRKIFVEAVTVTSVEQHAGALRDNEEIAAFARAEIVDALRSDGRYEVIDSPDIVDDGTLRIRVESNVRYGSRALRYMVGFGAGSGRVVSTLTGTGAGGAEKVRSVSESDLAMGVFGGSMKKVVRKNVRVLLRSGALLRKAED